MLKGAVLAISLALAAAPAPAQDRTIETLQARLFPVLSRRVAAHRAALAHDPALRRLAEARAARLARALAVLNVCDAHAPVTDSGGGDDELMRALAPASLPAAPLPLSSAARACAARRHHAAGHLLPAAEHAALCAAAQCNLDGSA